MVVNIYVKVKVVSVVLYKLNPSSGLTQPWSKLVIRSDGQFTFHAGLVPSVCPPYVFASSNLHLGMVRPVWISHLAQGLV